MSYPSNQQGYSVATGTSSIASFVFQSRDPSSNDISYPLYQGWVNKTTKAIWFLEALTSSAGVVTATWRSVAPLVQTAADPATSDYQYPLGQLWLNTSTHNFWILAAVSGTTATWEQVTQQPSGDLNTLSDDAGTLVYPTAAGDIQLSGSGSIQSVAGTNELTYQLTGLTNHAVLVGAGTSTITKLAVGTTGQLLVGATGADPAFASSANGDFTFTSSTSGATRTLTVQNSSNTSSSNAAFSAVVGGTSSGDAYYSSTNGTDSFTWGLKNSDSSWRLATGTNLSAATPLISAKSTGDFVFNGVTLKLQGATSSSVPTLSVTNSNTSGTALISATAVGTINGGYHSSGNSQLGQYFNFGYVPTNAATNPGGFNISYSTTQPDPSQGTLGICVSQAGAITKPNQPSFNAFISAPQANVTGAGASYVMVADSTVFTRGSGYNTGTGIYTVQTTGIYYIVVSFKLDGITAAMTNGNVGILINGSPANYEINNPGAVRDPVNNRCTYQFPFNLSLTAGQTVQPQITINAGAGNTVTATANGCGWFLMLLA